MGRRSAQGQVARPMRILAQGNASRSFGAGMHDACEDKDADLALSSSNPRKPIIPRSFESRHRDQHRQVGLGERILRTTASPRPELPRSITSPATVSSAGDLLSRVTTQTSVDSITTTSTTGTRSPRRGRTRTVVPIVNRGWDLDVERLPQGLAQSASVIIDLSSPVSRPFAEDLGIGVGGHKLGIRQPERQLPTPCASPPKRAVYPAPIPIPSRYASQEEKRASFGASPRDIDTLTRTERMSLSRSSLDVVENQVPQSTVLNTAVEEKPDHDIETIEEALTDAMETSLELLAIEEPDAYPFEPIHLDDTVRSKGKRKNQADEHQTGYPEKKGKTADIARKTLPEDFQRGRDRAPVDSPGSRGEKPLRRPLSLTAHRDSTSTVAISANVHASAEIVSRPLSQHTVYSPVAIRRRPSLDHLINALEMVADARTVSAPAEPRSKVDRRRTMPSVIRALGVEDGFERKARPTLVKQATEVIMVAQNTVATGDISVGTAMQPPDAPPISRTASISLKRIQDNDMERVMHAYQTCSRSHSPASQLEAAYRAHEASNADDTNGSSWETLHRRNVLDRARNVGADWMKGKDRAGTLTSLWPGTKGSLGSPSMSTGRPGLLNRSVSYAPDSPSRSKAQAESCLKAARRQSGGEITMMHTRWDGTKTPITEKDHPAHWAALKEHRLVRQRSKQSLSDEQPSSQSPSQSSAFAKNQDLGRVHNSNAAPPVSIDRWRQHLSQANGAHMPPIKIQHGAMSPGEGRQRPDYRHARTLPLPLDTACLSRSPTLTISGHSQDGNLPTSACSVSSFNAVKAYDQVKSETGLISFDLIPGLNGSESASQQSSNED